MTPNQFRIGNLVKYDGKITTVTDVLCDSLNVMNCDHSILYEMIEPVEITEEVLIGMGCEFVEEYNSYTDKYRFQSVYLFFIKTTKTGVHFRYNKTQQYLPYAHQLQNLIFALTGEEVTLNPELL